MTFWAENFQFFRRQYLLPGSGRYLSIMLRRKIFCPKKTAMRPLPFFSFARLPVRIWDTTITIKRNTVGAFVFCRPCKNGTGKGILQYGQQAMGAAILSQAGVQEIPALDGNALVSGRMNVVICCGYQVGRNDFIGRTGCRHAGK